jgi:3-deoxy-D-manno-octulosonate 8-phosphate phosphatase (KDO 8-P phosphatase)
MLYPPSIDFPAPLLLRAQNVRLVILDVDGVLTDGSLYFSEQGESIKRFSVLDGQGIKLLQSAGIEVAVITGRDSGALRKRLSDLKIQHAIFGTEDKLSAANRLLAQLGLSWQATAAMGDDWPDLALLKHAQLACAPANGHIENRAIAHFTSSLRGGEGAVRELCDLILVAQGHYARFLEAAQ